MAVRLTRRSFPFRTAGTPISALAASTPQLRPGSDGWLSIAAFWIATPIPRLLWQTKHKGRLATIEEPPAARRVLCPSATTPPSEDTDPVKAVSLSVKPTGCRIAVRAFLHGLGAESIIGGNIGQGDQRQVFNTHRTFLDRWATDRKARSQVSVSTRIAEG